MVTTIRDELLAVSASDETFRTKLEGAIYEENAGVTRFVLCALAEQSMTKETWVDLWKYEGKLFVWTIEHIFPQGDNIPASWVTMIADGDAKKAKTIQETHVHKLGNLTISGFNSALGNKSFKDKRDRTDSKGREVGYKNGLKLNAELATAETWSVKQIDTRTTTLVDQVMSLFGMTRAQDTRVIHRLANTSRTRTQSTPMPIIGVPPHMVWRLFGTLYCTGGQASGEYRQQRTARPCG